MEDKIEVFILFDREDRRFFLELKEYLASLENQSLITVWDEDQILGGTDRGQAIDLHLQSAPIVLLLVSARFIASPESYSLAKQALATHPQGYVVPVILHEVDWQRSDFGSRQPLPLNGKPISSWTNRRAAYVEVVNGIRDVIDKYKQSMVSDIEPANPSLVTIATPDGKQYTVDVSADMLVSQLLHIVLNQWLPLTLGTMGSQRFSLRPISLDRESTLGKANLVAQTNFELVAEALAPNKDINLRLEDKRGKAYTITVPLNTAVGQLVDDFLGTKSGIEEAIVEWILSDTRTKQLRLEASLYYQGVCDGALLHIYCIKTVAEE